MGNGQIKVWNYDYSQLDAETRLVVEQKTTEIRDRMGRAAQNIVEIGQRLIDVKAKLPDQQFSSWLRDEFNWGRTTAYRMMWVAEKMGCSNLEQAQIGPSALYLLADPSTPDEIRDQFIEQAKSGEPVTHAAVKAAVTAAKPQTVRVVASEIGEDEPEKQGVIPQQGHDVEEIYERSIETAFEKARERNAKPTPSETYAQLQDIIATGKRFGCVYADPAWPYGNQATRAATGNHYDTMSVDDICALPVRELVADNAHLHLWTTNAFLFDARRVMEAWGFEYKSVMVWVKPQMGIGNYWRVSHEFLLFGIRGRAPFGRRDVMSWQKVDRQKHSCKPDVFRRLVEQVSPGPYLEMFARQAMPGWTAWGNEVEQGIFIDALAG